LIGWFFGFSTAPATDWRGRLQAQSTQLVRGDREMGRGDRQLIRGDCR